MIFLMPDMKYYLLLIISFISMLVIGIMIFIIDQDRSNWVSGTGLLAFNLLFIVIQGIILSFTWAIDNPKIKLAHVIFSFIMLLTIVIGFIFYYLEII